MTNLYCRISHISFFDPVAVAFPPWWLTKILRGAVSPFGNSDQNQSRAQFFCMISLTFKQQASPVIDSSGIDLRHSSSPDVVNGVWYEKEVALPAFQYRIDCTLFFVLGSWLIYIGMKPSRCQVLSWLQVYTLHPRRIGERLIARPWRENKFIWQNSCGDGEVYDQRSRTWHQRSNYNDISYSISFLFRCVWVENAATTFD